MIKKMAAKSKDDEDDSDGFDGLFPSDLSDDEDDEDRFLLKEERGTKRKKDSEETQVPNKKKVKEIEKQEKETKKETKKTAKKKGDSKEIAPAAEVNEDDIADEICDFNMSDDDEEEMQNETSKRIIHTNILFGMMISILLENPSGLKPNALQQYLIGRGLKSVSSRS